jgi:hypothetical protein
MDPAALLASSYRDLRFLLFLLVTGRWTFYSEELNSFVSPQLRDSFTVAAGRCWCAYQRRRHPHAQQAAPAGDAHVPSSGSPGQAQRKMRTVMGARPGCAALCLVIAVALDLDRQARGRS